MQDKDDIQIKEIETKDGETVTVAAVPYATPTINGTLAAVIYALLVFCTVAALLMPQYTLMYAVGNGIAALLWFTLYRDTSSFAARCRNETNLARAIFRAELQALDAQVTEIIKKRKGNFSKENLSNTSGAEHTADYAEPKPEDK